MSFLFFESEVDFYYCHLNTIRMNYVIMVEIFDKKTFFVLVF